MTVEGAVLMRHAAGRIALGLASTLTLGHGHDAFAQAEPGGTPAVQADARERFAGAPFRYTGGDAQRTALHDAIARSVGHMNFIERPIARGRLRDRNPVYDAIAFRFPRGVVDVVLAGRSFQAPENGSPVPGRAITGEAVQVRETIQGGRVVQTLTSNEGVRRNEFSLSADGKHLTVNTTVTSPRLRSPLRYELSYGR